MCYTKEARGYVDREGLEFKVISWYERNKLINQIKVPETVGSIVWV